MKNRPEKFEDSTAGAARSPEPLFKRRSSIVFKLATAFIIGSMLPLGLSVAVSYRESVERTSTEIREHLFNLAVSRENALNEHTKDLIRYSDCISRAGEIVQTLRTGSYDPGTDPAARGALQLLSAFQDSRWGEIHHILLADVDGNIVLGAEHHADEDRHAAIELSQHLGETIAGVREFRAALRETRVTDVFGFLDRDHYHQLILQPVRDERDQTVGVVVLEVAIDYVQKMMATDFSFGRTGRIYLVSHTGERVVNLISERSGGDPPEGVRLAIAGDEPVVGEFAGATGDRVFGLYLQSSYYPWILCLEIDAAEVWAPIYRYQLHMLSICGAALLMLVCLAVLFSRRFGAPLRRAAGAVERIAGGDLSTPIAVTTDDEIGLVQAGVESMRLRLLEHIQMLDEQVEQGLRELQYQKMALDEHAIVSVTDERGRITYVNRKFCQITGYSQDELIGQDHRIVNSGFHPKSFFRDLYRTLYSGQSWRGEICNRAKHGEIYWVDSTIVPALDDAGNVLRFTSIRTDITARKIAQERFAAAVRGSRDGLWDWNLVTDEVYYAPQFHQMLGLADGALGCRPGDWINLILPDDLSTFNAELEAHLAGVEEIFECEFRMLHADGEPRWMLCRGEAIRDSDGRAIRIAGSLAEITEMKNAQRELKLAAEHDRLTGLPNRTLFLSHVQRAINVKKRRPEACFAVLFFDFDRFKVVNDSLGHDVGDELLIAIAGRFREELRPYDVAARFGGDEFVVLLDMLHSSDEALQIANRLLNMFATPYTIQGHFVRSTASIGMVTSDMSYDSADALVRDSDAAMYQAKAAGRGRVVVFDAEMHEQAMDRIRIEEDLEFAIENSQLRLHYQPIVSLENGELEGFEALVRWQHPERGLVPPDKFIGIAEDNGFIIEMGEWVLRRACEQAMAWRAMIPDHRSFFVNVNVSKRQLSHPDCIETIQRVLRDTDVDPRLIKIEITESTIVDNRSDLIPILQRIRAHGVLLAMDDFGTGHSSLSGLHRFPIDILKIDRSFIASMEESSELAAVVHSIVTLAQNLGMDIVAEGIETPAQIAILQSHEVRYGQGYFFSKPLPPEEAEEYLRKHIPSAQAA
ncbi:MAG: EAL domain-containing protein [Phycisphaeraceae bacterium]|nr:EAL domain-containing protein [Phycisphaeraceae bacterium]